MCTHDPSGAHAQVHYYEFAVTATMVSVVVGWDAAAHVLAKWLHDDLLPPGACR